MKKLIISSVTLLGIGIYANLLFGTENEQTDSTLNLGDEIILKVDFDSPIQAGCDFFEYTLPNEGYCRGKSGKGYYFQPPSNNFLPPEVASVEKLDNMFEGLEGAELKVVKTESPISGTALSVTGKGFRIKPLKTGSEECPYTVKTAITGSCFIKGTKGLRVVIRIMVNPCDMDDKKKSEILQKTAEYAWIKDTYKTEFYPDVSQPQTITLTGDWQRIAAYVEFDTRLADKRTAELSVSFDASSEDILVNGFQYEQTYMYPYLSFAPTSWMPGKSSRMDEMSRIELTTARTFFEKFPAQNGTISFWAKIPADCNLPEKTCGFFNFGRGWRSPMWYFSENRLLTGTKETCWPKFQLPFNQWFHVVVSWGEKTMKYYVNGKEINSQNRNYAPVNELDQYSFSIGGSLWEKSSSNAQMDEFYIFKKTLSENEITYLYNTKETICIGRDALLMSSLEMDTFFRNDFDAKLCMKVYSDEGRRVRLKWKMTDLPEESSELVFNKGVNDIEIKFSPALLLPGTWDLQVAVYSVQRSTWLGSIWSFFLNDAEEQPLLLRKNSKIEIKGQLRPDLIKFLSWGGEGFAPLNYLRKLGLNAIIVDELRLFDEATQDGMFINFYLKNIIPFKANNFDIHATEKLTKPQIEAIKKYFIWYGTLLNSEKFYELPMNDWKDYPQLMKQASEDLGFTPPLDKIEFLPDRCFPAENSQSNESGIFSPGQEFNTLWWFSNKGQTTIKLNTMNAKLIKSIAPNNLVWTEPPMSSGMFEGLDMVSAWSYDLGCAQVLERFKSDYAYARHLGKLFQPTLGAFHWINSVLGCKVDGKSKFLSLTVDELSANTWIAIGAVPAHDISFFNVYAWFEGENVKEKYLTEKDSSERFGKLAKEQLYPAAMLLRDMPMLQPKVGLLCPESTRWYSDRKSWMYWRVNYLWGRCLSKNQIDYDMLYENDVLAGKLENYNTIIFPLAGKISNKVHDALQQISDKATIVVDKYCNARYPNMKVIDHKFMESMGYNNESFLPCQEFIQQLYKDLKPSLDIWAEGKNGPVFVFERLYGGCKYIIVINNHWTTGEFNKYADEQVVRGIKYQPYGVAQNALISFKNDTSPIVYDFLSSRKIDVKSKDGRVEFETDLPPGGARIFCIYQHEFKEMTVRKQGSFTRGKEGEFIIKLIDSIGNAPGGRQILDIEVIDANGQKTDESGLYTMENGLLRMLVRFAVNSPPGKWTLNLKEHSSGLKKTFVVDLY